MPHPSVLFAPHAAAGLKSGFDRLGRALAATLGPSQGLIFNDLDKPGPPEPLEDAAAIARRVLQLPDRAEDVGAMLLRNLVWRMRSRVGDGGATAAVLACAILAEAERMRASGANPMRLRDGIKTAARAAIAALQAQARPAGDETDLIAFARTVTGHERLGELLGEVYDILGPDAHVTVEDYLAPYFERDYLEGGRWKGRLISPYLITDPARQRAVQQPCAVVLFAGEISDAVELAPVLELVAVSPPRKLALLAHEISGPALNLLVINHSQNRLPVVAAALRRPVTARRDDFEDLAALTGAAIISPELGRGLGSIRPADLGAARRVEADADEVIVVGDAGHSASARAQIRLLAARAAGLEPDDEALPELQMRVARLAGHVATLKIGAHSKTERAFLRGRAEKGLKALPHALRSGLVPGGGVAYLNCIAAAQASAGEREARWGAEIVARALAAPFRQIVTNAGLAHPGVTLADARRAGPTFGYDAVQDRIVDMAEAGIWDAAGVLAAALETAASGAIMALTTETIVLKKKPQKSYEP